MLNFVTFKSQPNSNKIKGFKHMYYCMKVNLDNSLVHGVLRLYEYCVVTSGMKLAAVINRSHYRHRSLARLSAYISMFLH